MGGKVGKEGTGKGCREKPQKVGVASFGESASSVTVTSLNLKGEQHRRAGGDLFTVGCK